MKDNLVFLYMLVPTFNPIKNKKKESKIQKDIHEKSLKDCPSWRWNTKMTSGKVGRQKCIRLTKLATQFWLKKGSFGENIFI